MENKKNIAYGADDIISLSRGRAYREKIGMYLSADRQEAINLGLRELIVNIQDEYEVYKPANPYCKIELHTKDKTIQVSDNMRGIPVGIREDGMNSLTAAFLIPHSGGKHIEGVYSSAVGVNGIGNKVVCHTAEWLKVTVRRDGVVYAQTFKSDDEGARPATEVETVGTSEDTGTTIFYKPDEKVYGDFFIDLPSLREMLTEMSYFAKGLRIELIVDGKTEVFYSKNGLVDGLNHKDALSRPFSFYYETDDCKVELALQWVAKKGDIKGYANGLYMPDGGAFISGFRSSLTRTFNSLAKTKYSGETIRDVLDGFVSVKVRVGQFSNQAKTVLANPEARTATSAAISACLKDFAMKRQKDFDTVVELLDKVARAEKAAERARNKILDTEKEIQKAQKRKIISIDKLKDSEFLGEDSTLLIVEGDSAAGAIAQARDEKHFGILAIRGKMINSLSNTDEKIFDNEEIKLLLSAMNIIPGKYDSKKLRYGRIGICVDGDADGFHIALLIMANLYYLAPDFIREGRLVWLKAPLYVVSKGKERQYYFSDVEFDAAPHVGEINRAKGLGALSPKQAQESMFGKWQRIEVLEATPEALVLLESLMGKSVEFRRDFIFENVDFSEIVE